MERHLATLEELQAEAAHFVSTLTPNKERATLVTLSGELGAGKTSFVQGIAKAFGVTEQVTSPTFVLERTYRLHNQPFTLLAHFDAYRLEGSHALAPLGFTDRMRDPGTLVLLEWPEVVQEALPKADAHIALFVSGEGRTISYE